MSRLNIVPRFIVEQDELGRCGGGFKAAVLFFDIVDFTRMTRELQTRGRAGAEELSLLLKGVLTPTIAAIYDGGGFVTGFAGDSLIALFPQGDGSRRRVCAGALRTAAAIRDKLDRRNRHRKGTAGRREVLAKLGLSFGLIEWGVLGAGNDKSFYFAGEGLSGCAALNKVCRPGEIVTTDDYPDVDVTDHPGDGSGSGEKRLRRLSKRLVAPFTSPEALRPGLRDEFRDVVSVFVALRRAVGFENLDEVARTVLPLCREYGGYFNGFIVDDKGPHLSCFFGAPRSHENNVKRALDFAAGVRAEFKEQVRVGISRDTVYTGFVGSTKRCQYTALGDAVNLAARLMQRAAWGEVLVGSNVMRYLPVEYEVARIDRAGLKGLDGPVETCVVEPASRTGESRFFEGRLIGRREELRRIRNFIERSNSGERPGVMHIYGNPGIGKSRLVYEVSRLLTGGVELLGLQSDEILQKSKNPFTAFFKNYFGYRENESSQVNTARFQRRWRRMIEELATATDERSGELVAELERTKSLLAALIGIYWEGSLYEQLNPSGRSENTLTAVVAFFLARSLLTPLVVAQDDLQWLDEESAGIYRALLKTASGYPITLLTLSRYRDDGGKPHLETPTQAVVEELELAPLPAGGNDELLADKLGGPADDELRAFVNERAAGNPFYLEQLALYLKENELLKRDGERYTLVRDTAAVPDSLRPMLIARIDRLSRNLRELVQVAAVLGREFEAEVLAGVVTSISKRVTRAAVKPLLQQGEGAAIWSLVGELLYLFKHALLREAAYEMQLFRRLRNLHGLVGETLERLHGDDKNRYADIAYHYHQAQRSAKAREYLIKAADFAKVEYMNEESLGLYETALDHVSTPWQRYEVLDKMAGVLHRVGRWEEQRVKLDECLALVGERGDKALMTRILNRKGLVNHYLGDAELSLAHLKRAVELASSLDDKLLLSTVYQTIGHIYTDKGQYDLAEENLTIALEIARSNPDNQAELASCRMSLGSLNSLFSKYKQALYWYEKTADILLESGSLEDQSSLLGNMGIVHMNMGHYDKADDFFREALVICRKQGFKRKIAVLFGNMGQLYRMRGDFAGAIELIERQIDIARQIGDISQVTVAIYNKADTYKHAGDYAAALKLIKQGQSLAEELQNALFIAVFRVLDAECVYGLGDYAAAENLAEEGLRMAERVKFPDAIYDAEVLLARLLARRDTVAGLAALDALLEKYANPQRLALLSYHRYQVSGNGKHRRLARERIAALYERTPDYRYEQILQELRRED